MTYSLPNDILNPLVEEADFLCQDAPLVCEERLTVSPTNRRTRGFLLENKMGWSARKYLDNLPKWRRTYYFIQNRCYYAKKSRYYKKGIKNFLTIENCKYLWFRDKAYLMKNPSIDRIDNNKHYTLENCRYLEKGENARRYILFKKLSDKTKLKMSFAHKGWRHTKESKRKLSLSCIGRKHTIEAKRKMSLAKLGIKNPTFGKERSQQIKDKISKTKKEMFKQGKIISTGKTFIYCPSHPELFKRAGEGVRDEE